MQEEIFSMNHEANEVNSLTNSDKIQLLERLKDKCKKVLNAVSKNQTVRECDVSSIEYIGTYFERILKNMLEQEFALNGQDEERIIRIVKQIKENKGRQSTELIMRNLYLSLERQNRSKRPQRALTVPLRLLFSQNLFFSPGKNHQQTEQKIIQGHSLRIRSNQFIVVFTLLTSNTMTAIVKHYRPNFETMVTIDVRDLSSHISSLFKDTFTLFKYLQSLRKVEAKLTDQGSLEISIEKRAFQMLQKVDEVYVKLTEIAAGALQFNQSDTFERIVEHRHHPQNPIASHIQQLIYFYPPKRTIEIVVLELVGKCEFQSAAKIYRLLIDDLLRDNPMWQTFQGRGNDEDLLNLLKQIKQREKQCILENLSYFDCLFICEYVNIDLERAAAWYNQYYQFVRKGTRNCAVIYGILNFCHQNHYYFLKNEETIILCRELENLCKDSHQLAASRLLSGIYYALSKRQPNRRQQYYTRAVVLARTIIGLDPKNDAAWLIICHSIMNNTLNIVQNPQFKGISYGVIQAEIWMKHPNDVRKAEAILSKIIEQNPHYKAAYHASLKLERLKLNQSLNKGDPITQLEQCITRAEGIYGQCSKHLPNDIYSRYLLAQILQYNNINRAFTLYVQCIKANPFMENAKKRLENVKNKIQ